MKKKNPNKKEIKKNLSLTLYSSKLFSIKNSFIKNYKELEGKVLVIYFGRKSNLGCKINC